MDNKLKQMVNKDSFLLSVVIPCFNEAENIKPLIIELQKELFSYRHEIILVDDGSTDETKSTIHSISHNYKDIYYISFSRNFGQQAALMAGICYSRGDAVLTIDADLQQPPSLIPKMVDKWLAGALIVEAIPNYTNSIGWFKKYSSLFYYWMLGSISEAPVVKSANDFRLIDRKIANIIKQFKENHLYLRGLYSWIGFKKDFVQYKHLKRANGLTHYPMNKMIKLALNGVTSSSTKPLRLALLLGTVVSLIALLVLVWALYLSFFTEKTISGWTSTIVSIAFFAGIQLFVLGIIGEYLGKLFLENKRRPNFIINSISDGLNSVNN